MQLGRGREKVVGEGREGAKSQEIEIAVVGDDYSAHVRALIDHVPHPSLLSALCHPFNAPILLFQLTRPFA